MIILISPTDSVELIPMVKLEDWSIQELQTADGYVYYFCGRIGGRGRISTRIVEWCPQEKIGRTESGRIYQLIDAPGDPDNLELQAIRHAWTVKYAATVHKDVTSEFVGKRH
ncbi:MAG: hypothetical protein CTY35_02990 [Methylotenera sp.]|jgi:hypothetical protein|nr:MAG: hypothetical protein CTY35_02990 [Methylotenera sp.]